jgi:hypothetical protein
MVEIHDLCMALIGNQLPNDWSGKSRTDAM